MDKSDVEKELTLIGFVKTDQLVDGYEEWVHGIGIRAYVGSWYVEQEGWGHAFPYKDESYTKLELSQYLWEGLSGQAGRQ